MHTSRAELAVKALKTMYEHNASVYTSVGRTEVGPEPLTAEQVAKDLRVIYNELISKDGSENNS